MNRLVALTISAVATLMPFTTMAANTGPVIYGVYDQRGFVGTQLGGQGSMLRKYNGVPYILVYNGPNEHCLEFGGAAAPCLQDDAVFIYPQSNCQPANQHWFIATSSVVELPQIAYFNGEDMNIYAGANIEPITMSEASYSYGTVCVNYPPQEIPIVQAVPAIILDGKNKGFSPPFQVCDPINLVCTHGSFFYP